MTATEVGSHTPAEGSSEPEELDMAGDKNPRGREGNVEAINGSTGSVILVMQE